MFSITEAENIVKILKNSKSLEYIKTWKFDKLTYSKDSQKVSKIEIYNYIKRENVEKLLKHLQTKKYKYTTDFKIIPNIFSVLLSKENKYTSGQGKIIEDITKEKYYYYIDFVKALIHRGSIFLIKIYRNKSQNKDFSKIEISYYYNNNSKYNLYYGTWINSLKAINEIIKRLSYNFEFVGYHEDYSQKIDFLTGIAKLLGIYPKEKIQKILKKF
ncbi:MAG: hypothetical protein PHI37_00565 [Candidatus Gracilibacteria bacterium]|nr:hypothetical protein [Candidatus Gracilibacteria bacterium]